MAQNRLRVYYGPEEAAAGPATIPMRDAITVPLGEVLPLLLDAVRSGRAWVDDFADDDITISSDLYEVLLAYQHFRRPSA
jgi:predicted nucleotidyltransferase